MASSGNPESSWNNFRDEVFDREFAKGEGIIWVITGSERPTYGYAAVPDTPYHRDEAKKLAMGEKAATPNLFRPYG